MRFLLDEMWSRVVAEQLRRRGIDAESVDERPPLRSLSDDEILAVAQTEGRVLVTENVSDFQRIADTWLHEGRRHQGILYTRPERFPRGGNRSVGRLIAALEALALEDRDLRSLEIWLD